MRYTITTTKYSCPNCKRIIKTTQNSDIYSCLAIIFFPITIIILITKAIIRKYKTYTSSGEEIITCKGCGKKVVIISGMMGFGGTRLMTNNGLEKDKKRDYSFGEYSLDDFIEYFKIRVNGDNNDGDYYDDGSSIRKGLLRIMELENISFESLVRNIDIISEVYYSGRKNIDILEGSNIRHSIDFFTSYLHDKRLNKISLERFRAFLEQEAIDNKIYNKNSPSSGESAIDAVLNGKTLIRMKITPDLIAKSIDILNSILDKDEKTMHWLSRNIATSEPKEWYNKYDNYKNPSLSDILVWFMQYCKYEKSEI